MSESSHKCEQCYWRDTCESGWPCSDFTPNGGEMTDKDYDDFIEKERQLFYDSWFEYIDERNW